MTEEQSVVIINLRKLIKEIDGRFGRVWVIVGRLGWLFLIVICSVLILCDIYTIVEKGRVHVVGKKNVECWGLFLILKNVKLTPRYDQREL